MFTGLVETTGSVISLGKSQDIVQIKILAPEILKDLYHGQSISVSGACLTITALDHRSFLVEMIPETAAKTTLGRLSAGSRVNIERALQTGSRLDGHLVTGHIDGIGIITNLQSRGRSAEILISADPAILAQMVPKGSVAVDGISLTIIDVSETSFSVGIIPATLKNTTLGFAAKGDAVNIESDILGKYVQRFLSLRGNDNSVKRTAGLTWDTLAGSGWTSS